MESYYEKRIKVMREIIQTAHTCCSINAGTDFYNNVNKSIGQMQQSGLEVEVQYQQSDGVFSAFIIGREIK